MKLVEHTMGGEAAARCISFQGDSMGISNPGAFPRMYRYVVGRQYRISMTILSNG